MLSATDVGTRKRSGEKKKGKWQNRNRECLSKQGHAKFQRDGAWESLSVRQENREPQEKRLQVKRWKKAEEIRPPNFGTQAQTASKASKSLFKAEGVDQQKRRFAREK